MKLLIDIPEDIYKSIKMSHRSGWLSSKEIEHMDKAISTGVPFDAFKEMASNRIAKEITELNKDLSRMLRCYQCEYTDIANAGECYLCIKGIQDCFTPKGEN